ncbi:MAG: SIR2 family protein [Candidatus Thiodiazotropha endolucinida]|uniref:SIR2 family protein n=1 Tax=Candidatus Thiodiazotropha taylori TaxID=2792791 RepID=A0A9E4NML0_9GAMM|nr:SIR2 family protein [Candidatus Thiodiazotropha taylori]MCW4237708.1 SIR2 family protein [Candidatus Thiodiazotropha endolucinida]
MEELLNTPEINELTDSVQAGRSVAFIGSGLSTGEYVGWGTLVNNLCEACGVDIDSDDDDLLELAQQAKNLSPDEYHRVLSEEFGKDGAHYPPGYMYLLESPFNAYVTINYDPLLAEASQFKGLTLYDFKLGLDASKVKNKAIFYIHGYVGRGDHVADGDLILTREDFERFYEHASAIIPSFLTQVLSFKPVVFIGCGLQEPALKNILNICNKIKSSIEASSGDHGPIHYILLPTLYTTVEEGQKPKRDFEKELEENAVYEEVGVRVVRYIRTSPKDYSPVEKLLKAWSRAPEIKPVSAYDEGPSYD